MSSFGDFDFAAFLDTDDFDAGVRDIEEGADRFAVATVRAGATAAGGLLVLREGIEEVVQALQQALDRIDEINERGEQVGIGAVALGVAPAELEAIEAISGTEARDIFAIAEGVEGRLRDLSDADRRALADLGFDQEAFLASEGADRFQQLFGLGARITPDDARGAEGEIFGGDDARRLFEIGARSRVTGVSIDQLAGEFNRQGFALTDAEVDASIRDSFERRVEQVALESRRRDQGELGAAFAGLPFHLGDLYEVAEELTVRANIDVTLNGGNLRADVSDGTAVDQIRPTPRASRSPGYTPGRQ